MDVVAERPLIQVDSTGNRVEFTLKIGRPYQVSAGEWACPIEAAALQPEFLDIRGDDSFQALTLAQWFLCDLMVHHTNNGGSYLWPDSLEPVDLKTMFFGRV